MKDNAVLTNLLENSNLMYAIADEVNTGTLRELFFVNWHLTVASVEQAFINTLASRLERSITWSVTITERALYLTAGDETYETAIRVKTGTL